MYSKHHAFPFHSLFFFSRQRDARNGTLTTVLLLWSWASAASSSRTREGQIQNGFHVLENQGQLKTRLPRAGRICTQWNRPLSPGSPCFVLRLPRLWQGEELGWHESQTRPSLRALELILAGCSVITATCQTWVFDPVSEKTKLWCGSAVFFF